MHSWLRKKLVQPDSLNAYVKQKKNSLFALNLSKFAQNSEL